VADLPLSFTTTVSSRLSRALDVEGKIPRALDALAPLSDADVLILGDDAPDGAFVRDLEGRGNRVAIVADPDGAPSSDLAGVPPGSAGVVLSRWSSFRVDLPAALAAVDRVLRPGGRLLVVHDYGRDDVSRLRPANLPEYTSWSRRDGWFLRAGFKLRVIHCWWTFETLDDCGDFLTVAFGEPGTTLAATLKRPRLSYNVAIYHRTKGDAAAA
jgi:hypothetical protein